MIGHSSCAGWFSPHYGVSRRPGLWRVVLVDRFFDFLPPEACALSAVVDDFGNLVRVP